ncbi:MAG: hypothetical protein R6U50_09025 [Desulfobacterales bacterium]
MPGRVKKMEDFFYIVEKAIQNHSEGALLKRYNADPNIRLFLSHDIITIDPKAFYEPNNHSIASITREAYHTHNEVAFTGIIDEENRHIPEFVRGETGNWDGCDWDAGDLLPRSYEKALDQEKKVSLGLTHPGSYGAICSNRYWSQRQLAGFKDYFTQKNVKTGLYREYGGDYCELYIRAMEDHFISRFSLIANPWENHLGVFELDLENKGNVIYHPWDAG